MDLSSVASVAAHLSAGWLVLTAVAILASLDALRGGTGRAAALALALPLTYVFLTFLPDAIFVGALYTSLTSAYAQAGIAAVVLVGLFVVLYRVTDSFESDTGFLSAVLAGIALAVVVGVTWSLIPQFNQLWSFGDSVEGVFGPAYRLWWLLGAYIALAFARG